MVLKRLGRVNNIYNKEQSYPSASLVIDGDIFKLYFDESVNLNLIKDNLIKKQNNYSQDLQKSEQKLANSSLIDKAPKNIVDQEKTNYNNLKNDIQKIAQTIESLK